MWGGQQEGDVMKCSLTGRRANADRPETPKSRDAALRESLDVGFGPTFDQARGTADYDVIAPWLCARTRAFPQAGSR